MSFEEKPAPLNKSHSVMMKFKKQFD